MHFNHDFLARVPVRYRHSACTMCCKPRWDLLSFSFCVVVLSKKMLSVEHGSGGKSTTTTVRSSGKVCLSVENPCYTVHIYLSWMYKYELNDKCTAECTVLYTQVHIQRWPCQMTFNLALCRNPTKFLCRLVIHLYTQRSIGHSTFKSER